MNIRQTFILCLYILLFWLCLPAILVLASIYLDSTLELNRSTSPATIIMGVLILAVSVPLLIVSIYQFKKFGKKYPVSADPPSVFIQKGLYAVWRHPIYLFYTLTLYSSAILWGSRGMLWITLPAFIILEAIYILVEEKVLRKRFGKSYVNYTKKTRIIVPSFYQILRIPSFFLFKILFSCKVSNREKIPDSLPFFLISSHRNYLDPLYLAYALPYPIRYITTFEMFRNPKSRWFFKAMKCIPKKRYMNDVITGRLIIKALDHDDVIGIFPEGERSWTGTMNTLKPETLNLFRKFSHIPILPVKLIGNFYAWPRWGKSIRRAKLLVDIQSPIRVNPDWDMDELEERLVRAIEPVDLDKPEFHCRSGNWADDISIVLYRCPGCRQFDSVKVSGKNECRCDKCGTDLTVDSKYGLHFTSLRGETEGVLDEFYRQIKISDEDIRDLSERSFPVEYSQYSYGTEYLVAYTKECSFSQEFPPRMEALFEGDMILTNKRIIFGQGNMEISLLHENIGSVTIESNKKLHLYDTRKRQLYQAVFTRESALKWQDFIVSTMKKELDRIPNTS